MRILMVNKYYPPHVGGIEFHVRDLAEGLVQAGHEVRVLVCNNEKTYKEEEMNGVEVVRLPRDFEKASTPVSFFFRKTLARFADEADLVHFHFPYPFGEFEWLRTPNFAQKKTPYVVTYHTDIVRQKTALALYKPFLQKFLDGAERIIASSPQLIEYSEFLAPRAGKCTQINFGLPVEHIAHNEAAKARAQELRASLDNKPIVLFVGRLVYYKGVDVLADALEFIDPEAHIVVIGRGELHEQMVARAKALGCVDRLNIIDFADNEELIAWYHAADVFTLPSVFPSEAFGLVQIEAHAAHTPVVSTLLRSGVPYANLDGVTGFSVEVGSAKALARGINTLLRDDALRAEMGERAQRRALEEFTVPRMIENTTRLYCDVLDAHLKQSPEVVDAHV